MISPEDIEDILYEDLKVFGIATFKKDVIPEGKVAAERIVIFPDETVSETYWNKNFVEVNFCVPDVKMGNVSVADKQRLKALSRLAGKFFDDADPSVYDGSTYRYSVSSIGTEKDAELECHCVNVKLLFEVLNVK
jgi:hypothetical protein